MPRRNPMMALVLVALLTAACGTSDDPSTPGDEARSDAIEAVTPAPPTAVPDQPTDSDGGSDAEAPTPTPEEPVEPKGTLTIGYAYPDVSAFATLNDKFSIGDVEQQAAAVLQSWERSGTLPVNGYDIELVFAKYRTLSNDDKLGACTSLAQDEEVFAVIAGRDFGVGSECLATRFATPVIDSTALPPSTLERGAPWLFSIRANEAEVVRAYVAWAEERGLFEGKTIGLFWDTRSEEAIDALEEALASVGREVASEVASDGEGVGSPQDQIAVERFAADGVDLAILLVGTSSVTNFLSFAEGQGYEPDYVGLEWANQLNDVATASLPQEQYDGTIAMAMSRVGGLAAGEPLSPQAEECLSAFEDFSGTDIDRTVPESGEFVQILFTCDLMALLLEGLRGAGPEITRESFVAALEGISDFPLSAWGDVSFGPGAHTGTEQVRTVEWSTECSCWTALDSFSVPGG